MQGNDKIRLFVDAHVFDEKFQGTRTFIKGIYSILAQQQGLTVYMGAFDIDNLKKDFPENDNIVFIKYKSRSGFSRLLYDIPLIIKRHKIGYAHFQYIIPIWKNCRYVTTIHDVIFNEYPGEFPLSYRLIKNFLFGSAARRSDIVTTVSGYSKAAIQKYLGIKPGKIHITHNGVSSKFFEPYDKKQAEDYIYNKYGIRKIILYVSRIEPRKNHISLLNAFLDLKLYSRGYHLALIGYESIKVPAFDKTVDNLPPEAKQFVFISSEIDDTDLLALYRASTVFVYPSKAEGFGIPPLEAAALKVPVICSNTTAMSDFTFFGGNHIDPSDHDLLKRRLSDTIDRPHDEAYLTGLAETIRQQYSWTASAENLYQAILNDRNQ